MKMRLTYRQYQIPNMSEKDGEAVAQNVLPTGNEICFTLLLFNNQDSFILLGQFRDIQR